MPPTTLNTKLKSVIESLKLNASKKKQSPEVTDSLEQLNSTVKLLASIISKFPPLSLLLTSVLLGNFEPLAQCFSKIVFSSSPTLITFI